MSKPTFRASNTQQGLTENMQILTGQKGDRLDKALTLREAALLGLVNLRRNGSGQIVPGIPPGNSGDQNWSGVQQPVAPAGVTADGAFHTITLTWDAPAYKGHSYAEILRSEVDNPASAVAIGTTLANVYSDPVGKGFAAFYWVRFVNKNGMVGPLHSTSGLYAITSPRIEELIASATHFAIYNPAKPTEKEIIFGVTDGGKIAIREAVIKAAAIQIIHSEKISADYIKAGSSISSPLITGGQIDMGNAFMAGGAAGFGKGGPYGGWGWGWHTIIYSDGSLYTNRLRAEGGYVRNMVIGNCTIEQDCVVRGTVYAERIIGDVVRPWFVNARPASSRVERHVSSMSIGYYGRARNISFIMLDWSALKITSETGAIIKHYGDSSPTVMIPAGVSTLHAYMTSTLGYGGVLLVYI
ncbi:DUF3672 domain-containing protein [Aeromonas sp. SG16]|uniref:DUF3672 domain-containing protein n=1 Tax=Aeromonas sp. SG16 TaxID=2950548 RepID=UPI002108F984|nr:DUF3672 domain-containing protein [Aeromonas sp. SG16]MCQ4053057.1 DUF3672 domain-containing protein [Aeromonas sp. SG16]